MNYRANNQITALELRVIDDAGAHIGVMPREAALNLAKEKNLDLIEIVPTAKPPVAQIISFDKLRYQKEKEWKKQRLAQKKIAELKQVRISPRAAQNDLEVKAALVEKFLQAGHKVEINLFLKGREKYNREWGLLKLKEFLKIIKIPHKITMEPRFIGRGFVVQVSK
ncbi:MAG: translation initiation factor IF-3 [Patescibacteria group bacterium]